MDIRFSARKVSPDAPLSSGSLPRKIFGLFAVWLVSACSLFGEIMPFGAALFAAEYASSPPIAVGVLAILSTLFPRLFPAATIKYALAISLFCLLVSHKGEILIKTPLRRGALMGGCVCVAGLFMLFSGQLLMYDCFLLIFEAGMTMGAVCLFANARHVLTKKDGAVSPGDILSVSALLGVAVLGVSGFVSLYGFSLTVPLSVLFVLLLTHENGMVSGAVSGIIFGLFVTLESGVPLLGSFAAAGMAAGYFSRFGRAGAALAFITGSGLVTFYSGGQTEMVLSLAEVIAPSLIYLSLPPGLIGKLRVGVSTERSYPGRMQTLLAQSLREKSDAFSYISETFTDIAEQELLTAGAADGAFFEKAAASVCKDCKKLSFCWKREFHRTYASFFVLLEVCEREGSITPEDLPSSLTEKCIRRAALCDGVNRMYAVYKVDKLWESRMREARSLVARQLSAVSHVFSLLEKDVKNGFTENRVQEDILRTHLSEQNVLVRDLAVLQRHSGLLAVTLSCDADRDTIQETVSHALSMPMEITFCQKGHFRLVPARRVHLKFWGETVARDGSEKSGDSFEHLFLESGVYAIVLSDGMGSGARAGRDSRAAVNMLCALFSAGFDTETAVSLVNSTLVLKSAEESFATLDILLLNTRTLSGEFIKAGSAASFIRRDGKVHTFSAPSMPCGMLSSPEAARIPANFAPGDMIVMVSDGVQDPDCRALDTAWLSDAIQNFSEEEPRVLSRHLLRLAKEKSGGKVRDDLTVLCALVTENGDFVA